MTVIQRCNGCGLVVLAVSAIAALFAAFGFGRSLGLVPIAEAVTLDGYGSLCYKNLTADVAVRALGKTAFGASGLNRRINYRCMTQRRNDLLRQSDLTASRALLAFGKTRSCAGRLDRGINDLGMSKRRNLIRYIAIPTLAGIRGITLLGAGGGSDVRLIAMSGFVYFFGISVCASRASKCLNAHLGTSRLGGNYTVVIRVSKRRNYIRGITIATLAGIRGITLLGAGGGGDGGNIVMDMTAGYSNILAILYS